MSNVPRALSPRRTIPIPPAVRGCALLMTILLALALPAWAAGPAILVKNINTTLDLGQSSFPSELVAVGNTVYFSATGPAGGGLWRSDGTPAGTTLVKDVYPLDITNVNGTLFFRTPFDNDGNSSFWRSDGTPAGTTLIKDLSVFTIMNVNGTLFLGVFEPSTGGSLWRSDGTAAGTTLIKDLGAFGSISSKLVNVQGTVFFILKSKTGEKQLWKSDGTAGGTAPVKTIEGHSGTNFHVSELMAVQNTLFFVAGDLHSYTQLWRSDGTAPGTILLKEFTAAPPQDILNLSWLTELNGKLFFTAPILKGNAYLPSLWRSDGTVAGTFMVKNITPIEMTRVGGALFLSTGNGPGELWKSDGTEAGTTLVKSVCADSGLTKLTDVAGTLFFACRSTLGTTLMLWKSDGSAAGTTLAASIPNIVPPTDIPSSMTDAGGRLFFVVYDDNGFELWKSDGTQASTGMVKDINPPIERGSSPSRLVEVNGTLFFIADDGGQQLRLWKSDGTEAGTTPVKVISSIPFNNSRHYELARVGNTLFFVAQDIGGDWLWKSDGTEAGTIKIKEINGGYLTDVNGTLFFVAGDRTELWKSDGTEAGTVMVKDFGALPLPAISELASMDGALFFSVETSPPGCCTPANPATMGLWRSDGTPAGTVMLKAVLARHLTPVNGMLFFSGMEISKGLELWRSDGTPGGTMLVKDIYPGAISSFPAELTNVGGTLLFTASDNGHGIELWRSNGTEAGTTMVKDIVPGTAYSLPSHLTDVRGTLFFAAADESHGFELWRSDGTAAGTTLVKDIYPGQERGINLSMISVMMGVNQTLYFNASDGQSGIELWKSDGTEAGTTLVTDIAPGDADSLPEMLTVAGEHLFFRAQRPDIGMELWAVPGDSDTYVAAPSLVGAPPDGVATIPLAYGNNGIVAAGPVTLTVTLASGLTYLGDTTGISPTVGAGTLTWRLPSLERLEQKPALLRVGLPAAAYGTRYTVGLALTTTGAEPYPPDNTAQIELMVARQMYLPLARR